MDMKSFKKDNPYHVWIVHKSGKKFVGHYKNREEAERLHSSKSDWKLGKETTASNQRKKTKKRSQNYFGGGGFKFPKFRF